MNTTDQPLLPAEGCNCDICRQLREAGDRAVEHHCPDCGSHYPGDECPICAPLERARRAAQTRRELSGLRRHCTNNTFAELSQPKERD